MDEISRIAIFRYPPPPALPGLIALSRRCIGRWSGAFARFLFFQMRFFKENTTGPWPLRKKLVMLQIHGEVL